MKNTGKFETAVTALLEGTTTAEWTLTQYDLLNLAATVDRLAEDLTALGRRLTRSIAEINDAVGRNASYINPLHGNHVMEFSDTLGRFNAFRESLYTTVGMVMGPEAKKRFISDLV